MTDTSTLKKPEGSKYDDNINKSNVTGNKTENAHKRRHGLNLLGHNLQDIVIQEIDDFFQNIKNDKRLLKRKVELRFSNFTSSLTHTLTLTGTA
jgi:hypothetical protein